MAITDQKSMVPEKGSPLFRKQSAIGLERIDNPLPPGKPLLTGHCPAKEILPGEQWFAPVPGKSNLWGVVGSNGLTDDPFQKRIRHQGFPAPIKIRFFQIIAIGTAEIAA